MSRLPPRPNLSWREDAPYSEDVGDIYFAGDGLAEARAVFLAGCGLPEGWAGRDQFVIGELGFGSGLNFLAAWDAWRRHRPTPTAHLFFVSVEGALMAAEDAARVHARWPELSDLSHHLTAQWPARARGLQAIDLPDGVRLILVIDEVAPALQGLDARMDAWFLDGFAPARNPDMWSPAVFSELARLSAPGARLASYTVAGDVRRGLAAAGFEVERKPGHGGKRERLEATRAKTPAEIARTSPRRVAVLGAGVAGAWAARAFLDRGCEVEVLDRGLAPAAGASGNPLALVMPRLDATDTPIARVLIAAFLHAQRQWRRVGDNAAAMLDVVRTAGSERERAQFGKLLHDPPLDDQLLHFRESTDGEPSLLLSGCLAIAPHIALPRLLRDAQCTYGAEVQSLASGDDEVRIDLANGETRTADLVVVCAGADLPRINVASRLAIEGRLGQIESMPHDGAAFARADGGYVVSALGHVVFGSTFEPALDREPKATEAARTQNLAVLQRLSPGLEADGSRLVSRAGIRATTRDRLPFAGPAPDTHGRVRLLGGLGARGFLWAPLLADLIAAEAFGEPSPVEASVRAALHPDRLHPR